MNFTHLSPLFRIFVVVGLATLIAVALLSLRM
jgi:hypothetical protein